MRNACQCVGITHYTEGPNGIERKKKGWFLSVLELGHPDSIDLRHQHLILRPLTSD